MEINQAAQTFLFFFFIFFASLSVFAFYIKFNKRSSKISLINAVQTSLLTVGIFTLFVFAGSYYFVLSDAKVSEQPLKDALSITASFFGGFATLTAAYIASRLFNDWKDAHNANIKKSLIEKALDSCDLHEVSIFKSTENIGSIKSKLKSKLNSKSSISLRVKLIKKNDNNYDNIISIVNDSHSSFLWGKNIIWKHLMCLQNEKSINTKINIELIIKNLSSKSREISNVYLDIINNDDVGVKIKQTDALNKLLAGYIIFMSQDIYVPLSSLRFEVNQSE